MIGLSPLWLAALGERADVYGRQFLLDAATGLVLPGFAYSRSGPALWLPQQDGSLASFAADVLPRSFGVGGWGYEFHPGWNQLLKDSHDISQLTNWGPGTAVVVSKATGLVAPDGSTPCRMRPTSDVTTDHNVSQGSALATVGQAYTSVSVVKQDGYRYWRHRGLGLSGSGGVLFDLQAGTVLALDAWSSAGVLSLRDGYKLCWSVGIAATTVPPIWHIFDGVNYTPYAGNGTDGVIVAALNFTQTGYLVPLTVATASTVPIGTHTMAATLSSLGVTLGAEYTIGMEYEVLGRIANQYPPVAQLRVGTTGGSNVSSGFFVHPNGTQFAIVRDTADVYLQQSGAAGFAKSVLGVKAANFRAASNGVLAAAGSTGTPPSGLTAIQVARDGGGPSGAMRVSRLYLIPARRAPDAELAAMTA